MDRSPNATREQLQATIDLLRARGDAALDFIEAQILFHLNHVQKMHMMRLKLLEIDNQMGITTKDRATNYLIQMRELIGDAANGMTDDQVIQYIVKEYSGEE